MLIFLFLINRLGADVIYDPVCLPHLVRVLTLLLNQTKLYPEKGSDAKVNGTHETNAGNDDTFDDFLVKRTHKGAANVGLKKGPMALIASVIRNVDTFNKFLALLDEANLSIEDLTESLRPFNFLPYMQSYDRSTVRLFAISCK